MDVLHHFQLKLLVRTANADYGFFLCDMQRNDFHEPIIPIMQLSFVWLCYNRDKLFSFSDANIGHGRSLNTQIEDRSAR